MARTVKDKLATAFRRSGCLYAKIAIIQTPDMLLNPNLYGYPVETKCDALLSMLDFPILELPCAVVTAPGHLHYSRGGAVYFKAPLRVNHPWASSSPTKGGSIGRVAGPFSLVLGTAPGSVVGARGARRSMANTDLRKSP